MIKLNSGCNTKRFLYLTVIIRSLGISEGAMGKKIQLRKYPVRLQFAPITRISLGAGRAGNSCSFSNKITLVIRFIQRHYASPYSTLS